MDTWRSAAPGEKLRGAIRVPGTDVEIPFTVARGPSDGPTVLVSGGVHGGEYPGIAAAVSVARRLDAAGLRGTVIVLHLTNPPAFWGKSQYWNPLDGKNLNRCFPGDPEGSASERMAAAVTEIAKSADYWIDMHGGDIHEALVPFATYADLGTAEVRETAHRMAAAYGIPRLLVSSGFAGGTFETGAQLGKPAILAEAGQMGQLDPDSERTHVEGVENVLRLVGVLPGDAVRHAEPVVYTDSIWSRAAAPGFWRCAVHAGDQVAEGDLVGTLTDVYGDLLQEVTAPQSGEVLFVATSYAIGADDPLFAVAVR